LSVTRVAGCASLLHGPRQATRTRARQLGEQRRNGVALAGIEPLVVHVGDGLAVGLRRVSVHVLDSGRPTFGARSISWLPGGDVVGNTFRSARQELCAARRGPWDCSADLEMDACYRLRRAPSWLAFDSRCTTGGTTRGEEYGSASTFGWT